MGVQNMRKREIGWHEAEILIKERRKQLASHYVIRRKRFRCDSNVEWSNFVMHTSHMSIDVKEAAMGSNLNLR
jgi:hypothetical protein